MHPGRNHYRDAPLNLGNCPDLKGVIKGAGQERGVLGRAREFHARSAAVI
jgi:hypothetical protein